ncbi:hypothetical protein GFS60_04491 [Rhodococcus sp. WAY2]|nr:hypothetical protein GFS60_04491 [Rhodococcus sp. WAY2]
MTDIEFNQIGPIDYLVVEFPAEHPPDASALPHLLDLVERNIIRVLDSVFVRRTPTVRSTGSPSRISASPELSM